MSDTVQAIVELRQSVDALTASNNARMSSIEARVQTGVSAGIASGTETAVGQVNTVYQQTQQLVDTVNNRLYPTIYSTPPLTRPSGLPCVEGDECWIITNGSPRRYAYISGTWTIEIVDGLALGSNNGAGLVGFDNGTSKDVLEYAKPMADFVELRAYSGTSMGVRVRKSGIAGNFTRDPSDTTTADNGGTVIVDATGRRWKRVMSGPLRVAMFGAFGVPGVDYTTELASAHAVWCALCESAPYAAGGLALVYDAGEYRTTSELRLPNSSGWEIKTDGPVTMLQMSDNTPIFRLLATAARSVFKIRAGFRFRWQNDQSVDMTKSLAICFDAAADIPDGLYNWVCDNPIVENGYRGIAVSTDAIAAGYNFPLWGFLIDRPVGGSRMSGALCAVGNFGTTGGAPASVIRKTYVNRMSALEPAIIWSKCDSASLPGFEGNHLFSRTLDFRSCIEVRAESVRFEFVDLPAGGDLITVAGSSCDAVINGLSLQKLNANMVNSTDRAFVVNAYQSLVTVHGLTVRNYTKTVGNLHGYLPRLGGLVEHAGRFVRTSDALDFCLYDASQAAEAAAISYAGQREHMLYRSPVGAGQSYVPMFASGEVFGISIASDCWLTSLIVRLVGTGSGAGAAAPITAGTLIVQFYINGTAVPGYLVTMTAGLSVGVKNAAMGYSPGSIGSLHKLSARDVLGLKIYTSSDFTPVTTGVEALCVLAPA